MTTTFFDTETFPIRPGLQAPKIVCVQLSGPDRILLREPGLDAIEAALDAGDRLVGHNVAYDVLCCAASRPSLLPKFFAAYEAGLVECTQVREKLIRIAEGKYKGANTSLLGSLKRHRIAHSYAEDAKTGNVRTGYAQYDGVPVGQWPKEFVDYAMEDISATRNLWLAQQEYRRFLEDQHRQARADFFLKLMSAWGMRTDLAAVAKFAEKVEQEHHEIKQRLIAAGLVRHTGTRNQKAAAERMVAKCAELDLPIPRTDSGGVSLTADDVQATGDSLLIDYARYGSVKNLRARTARLQAAGSLPIQPRFNVLVESGRTSCSGGALKAGQSPTSFGDQVQNPHRTPGVREGYRARDGHVLISVDYSSAELHTLAQVCLALGFDSQMAVALNDGKDLHLDFASRMMSWEYAWAKANKSSKEVKFQRQQAKAANFGFPGGLGVDKFRMFAAGYGVSLTRQQAQELKNLWMRAYPEMRDYFAHINDLTESGRPLKHIFSNRYRGDVTYCSAANSYFQGLASDMAKDAGFRLAKACYLPGTVLYGSRLWNFVHDEFILECPEDLAHECALEIVRHMEDAGKVWCPDVPTRAEPAISRSWRKGAEPVYRDGRLIPWEDRDLTDAEREKIAQQLARGVDPWYVSWDVGISPERVLSA